MKAIYTMEQMQELGRNLDGLTVTGIQNCKLVALCVQIIDNPVEIEDTENAKEDKEDDKNEPCDNQEDNPQHE